MNRRGILLAAIIAMSQHGEAQDKEDFKKLTLIPNDAHPIGFSIYFNSFKSDAVMISIDADNRHVEFTAKEVMDILTEK